MKILHQAKILCQTFGVFPKPFAVKRSFNKRNVVMLILHGLSVLFYGLYILCEANTFKQFADAVFMVSAAIMSCHIYVHCFWKSVKIMKLFQLLEPTINKSKWQFIDTVKLKCNCWNIFTGLVRPASKSIYEEFHRFVELFTNFFYIGLVKIIPIGSMAPLLVISFFIHYTTDLGRDAFYLPFPMW